MAFELMILMMLPLALEGLGETACSGGVDSSGVCIAAAKGTGLLQVNIVRKHAELDSDAKSDIIQTSTTAPTTTTTTTALVSVAKDKSCANFSWRGIPYTVAQCADIATTRGGAYFSYQISALRCATSATCDTLISNSGWEVFMTPTTTTTTTKYENLQYLPTKYYGVWDRANGFTKAQRPFLRGWSCGIKWSDFEPQEGTFDFTELDTALSKANQYGGSFYAMVWVGPDSPAWIYNQTVKVEVEPDPKHPGFSNGYPYYLDPIYISLRNRMLNTFANYIRNHVYSANVGFVQANFGCTGDTQLYKTPPVNPIYQISTQQKSAHVVDTWGVYKAAFQDGLGRVIPIIINPIDDNDPVEEALAIATFKALGVKGSAYVRGHHLTGERTYFDVHRPKFLNSTLNSPNPFFFARAEMDQTWTKPLFQINVKLGFHWGILNGLTQGLAVHDVTLSALTDCYDLGFADSFEFFNLYAPQIWPHNSTNAFIALHEGLDASDLSKFPSGDMFGPSGLNLERITKICTKYAEFGCSNDDPTAAYANQVVQRDSQVAYNDVGYDIWPTNYGRWIEQIDADVTSQGLFRIGGTINSSTSKYARFARGLKHEAGKTGMYFKLSKGFFAVTAPGLLSVHVIWFDNIPGSFQVKYADQSQLGAVALDQVCVGDMQWKHAYFSMNSLRTGVNLKGSDFYLVSQDSTDVIVHMIEISREL